MKILIATDWYLRLVVEGQALGLRELGHEVRVLCRDHALEFGDKASERNAVLERLRSAGIPVIELPGRRFGPEGMPATMKVARRLRDWGVEVVSAHENADPRLLLAGLGVPIVYTIHDPEPHPGEVSKTALERMAAAMWLRASDRLVVHGPQLVDQLPERVRHRQSVSVVPHGIDVAEMPAPIPAEPLVLLLGRLEAYKGISDLAAAMQEVWAERPDARLRIAGRGPAACEVPEDPRIELREGYIPEPEVPNLLRQARVVALPYTQASQSGVGLMSIAEGIPIVVTRTGALPELVADESYIAEPAEPSSLARCIVAALAADAQERQRVLEFARERFSWNSVAADYVRVYEEVAVKGSRLRAARTHPGRIVRRLALEVEGLPRKALRSRYGFDSWHTRSARANPYVRDIVRVLNERDSALRHSAVEIGCGLGDIIGHLNYRQAIGLDMEVAVIRAARVMAALRRTHVQYRVFNFPKSRLEGVHDAIVVVNWIHSVPPHDLHRWFRELFNDHLTRDGVLVFDTVADPEYRYNHSVDDLTRGLACATRRLGRYERGREVFIVERL